MPASQGKMPMMTVSVIIPVYNEAPTIQVLIEKVKATATAHEILIVDDGSTDNTPDILSSYQNDSLIKVFRLAKNSGKGSALAEAFRHAKGDILLIQDADLEYDPQDYPKLIEPILSGQADVVYGSRFLGDPHRVLYYWHYLGNKFLTTLSNIMTNLNLNDMETGYKVFKKECVQNLTVRSKRFGIEPELTAKFAKGKWRIFETGISYAGRTYSEGKKVTWRDGFAAVFTILWFRFFD